MVTFLRDNIFTWFQFSGSSTWLAAVPSCLIVVTVTRLHIPTKLFIGTFYMVKTKLFRQSFYYTSIKIKQKTRPETHYLFCLPMHYIFSKYIYLYLFPRLFFLKTHCFEECNHCSRNINLIKFNYIKQYQWRSAKIVYAHPYFEFLVFSGGRGYLIGFDVNRFK